MSNAAKATIGALVVVILGIVVWFLSSGSPKAPENMPVDNTSTAAVQNTTDNSPAMSAASNTTDAGIDQDMTSIDSQTNGLNSDTANIDAASTETVQ